MQLLRFFWFTLLILLLPVNVQAQKLRVSVVGYNQKPVPRFDLILWSFEGEKLLDTFSLKPQCEISVETQGEYWLTVAGVFHRDTSFPILLLPETEYTVQVQLRPLQPLGNAPQIIGDFNDFSWDNALPLRRVGEKIFEATVPVVRDSVVAYQIVDTVEGIPRSFNGTASDAYQFDGSDYISILKVSGRDSITIRCDYNQFPSGTYTGKVEITADGNGARLYALWEQCRELIARAELIAYEKRERKDLDWAKQEWRKLCEALQLIPVHGEFENALLSLATLYIAAISDTIICPNIQEAGKNLLAIEDPRSWIWNTYFGNSYALAPCTVLQKFAADSTALRERLLQIALLNPPAQASALYALAITAFEHGDILLLRTYIAELRKKYPRSIFTFFIERYDPDNPIKVGAPLPEFQIPKLEDTTEYYTNRDFRGSYVLIDFWATWCGPCRMELPFLHEAYQKYKAKNFTILSISLDRSPEVVQKFRQSPQTPMPWQHAFAPGGFQNPVVRHFRVKGIPAPILVGPDGTIIALDADLRGEKLERTLQRLLQ